jgi:nanoRNase/pAp phosphatase (c-di-AMP/oligoRNAs hydrolase)
VLREAFGRIGSAGGHADMAGAQITLGMLVADDESDPGEAIEDVIIGQFLEAMRIGRGPGVEYGPGPAGDR